MNHNHPASRTFQSIIQMANPAYIVLVIGLPVGALTWAINSGNITFLNYIHVLTGVLWTGVDLFYGIVFGPMLAGLDVQIRASLFRRLTPKMTFLMPTLAGVTITSGINLAQWLQIDNLSDPWILAAAIIVAILTVQGMFVILPVEISIWRQLLKDRPDLQKISRRGMITAAFGGIQGIMQLGVIYIMANIRF